jgi:hypothetical protein
VGFEDVFDAPFAVIRHSGVLVMSYARLIASYR